jgi:hypothetical protein
MDLQKFKLDVQALFPFKFEDTIMYSDDPDSIDTIINASIRKATTGFEKIIGVELTNSQPLPGATSILKCVLASSIYAIDSVSVWASMPIPDDVMKVDYYFGPERYLRLYPSDATVWVEYVKDPELLTLEDLTPMYVDWAIQYSVAMLQIKEGMLGGFAKLTDLPFEFNYSELKDIGTTSKSDLDMRMDDMSSGTLAIRIG